MATLTLDTLRSSRASLIEEVDALTSDANFDPTDPTFTQLRERADHLDSQIKALIEWQERRNSANAIDAASLRARKEVEARSADPDLGIGELWTRSAQWTDYLARPRGNSGMLDVPWESLQARATLSTSTFPGVIQLDRIRSVSAPQPPTPLLDLIPTIPVSGNSVEWIVFGPDPEAQVVAELAQKPEAAFAISMQNVQLSTIAHFAKYSRQFAADSGLTSYIDASLRRGVTKKMESVAENALLAATIPIVPNTGTLLEGIRLATAALEAAGWSATAALCNPSDLAAIDISIMNSTLSGPVGNGSAWGVRLVPVPVVPSGTSYVGEWSSAMANLVRQSVTVYTTDSDISGTGATATSDFRANILTTLAEGRSAGIVQDASAARKVSGTVSTTLEGIDGKAAASRSTKG